MKVSKTVCRVASSKLRFEQQILIFILTKNNAKVEEAATKGFLCKKVFLEISQNSQENTCARFSFLIKLKAEAYNFIKKLWHWCFPVNLVKFL